MGATKARGVAILLVAVAAGLSLAQQPEDGKGKTTPNQSANAKAGARLAERIRRLIAQLGDDSFRVRERASQQLADIGRPALPALRKAADSPDLEVRRRAERAVEAIQTTPACLLEDLQDKDPKIRIAAAKRLEGLGPKGKFAVAALTEGLKAREEEVREAALPALIAVDPGNATVTKVLPLAASVKGKYGRLLRRIKVPQDRQQYQDFHDWGHFAGAEWAGYTDLPAGFWVYVYPHWYIWGELKGK